MSIKNIEIESSLNISHKDKLEELLFFNKSQRQLSNKIVTSITNYGLPVIVETDLSIKVRLDSKIETHSLFLTTFIKNEKRLLGVALVIKGNNKDAILLHVAMDNEVHSEFLLLFITKIRKYLKQFKNIDWLNIQYIDKNVKLKV
jgi:hypothetical protein